MLKTDNLYDLWKLPELEQQEFLGQDIGIAEPCLIIELDEQSQRWFYNNRFAPLIMRQYRSPMINADVFQIIVYSIDDAFLNMHWVVTEMTCQPWEARLKVTEWLTRTGYFVNLAGLEAFCTLFGKAEVQYN
jgi:hypothetical protein